MLDVSANMTMKSEEPPKLRLWKRDAGETQTLTSAQMGCLETQKSDVHTNVIPRNPKLYGPCERDAEKKRPQRHVNRYVELATTFTVKKVTIMLRREPGQ